MSSQSNSFILTIKCTDTKGIVAAVSTYLRDLDCFIEESSHYGDQSTNTFFMRTVFCSDATDFSKGSFEPGFEAIADQFSMEWDLHDTKVLPRVVLMVSRFDHCLNDLLFRYRTGALKMQVPAIVSNHMDMASLAEWHKIPFFHIPVTKDTKPQAESRLMEIVDDTKADVVVLARYMQVLSDDLCRSLQGRAINIHHSFLPSFKGAKPYHRAHERGVKLIGATAHYVTGDLDEGPIIEQTVERVDHTHTADEMVAIGRDVESLTLSRALKYHLEHRVFLNGNKTVVFRR